MAAKHTRKPLMAGNWKMHYNHLEAIQVVQKLSYRLDNKDYDEVEVVVCPAFTALRSVQTTLESDKIPIEDLDQAGPTEGQTSGSAGQSTSEETGSASPYDPGGDVHSQGYKTATPNQTPGDLVEDDLKTTSDVSQTDLNRGASAGADEKQAIPEPNREPYAPGEHLDHDFRTRVENTKVVTIEEQGIGPRDPYPEGNPPDPEQEFQELHGYPRPEPDDDRVAIALAGEAAQCLSDQAHAVGGQRAVDDAADVVGLEDLGGEHGSGPSCSQRDDGRPRGSPPINVK